MGSSADDPDLSSVGGPGGAAGREPDDTDGPGVRCAPFAAERVSEAAEAGQVGVYYLFGSNDDETPQCYIGQSGNVGARLQQHTGNEGFLDQGHGGGVTDQRVDFDSRRVLGVVVVGRATAAGRYVLLNGNQASNPFTPEPLEADCQEFIDTVAVLLATLGAPVLESIKTGSTGSGQTGSATDESDELFLRHSACDATGYLTSEGMLVLAGSRGRPGLVPSAPTSIGKQRDSLKAEGVISVNDKELIFLKDYLFSSPSAAGCVLTGRSTNGRTGWRNAKGLSINDLEQLALSASTSGAGEGEL